MDFRQWNKLYRILTTERRETKKMGSMILSVYWLCKTENKGIKYKMERYKIQDGSFNLGNQKLIYQTQIMVY